MLAASVVQRWRTWGLGPRFCHSTAIPVLHKTNAFTRVLDLPNRNLQMTCDNGLDLNVKGYISLRVGYLGGPGMRLATYSPKLPHMACAEQKVGANSFPTLGLFLALARPFRLSMELLQFKALYGPQQLLVLRSQIPGIAIVRDTSN